MILKNNERLDDLQFNNLKIIQNSQLYSFTSDAVALANFAKVHKDGRVVDLCSGNGVIGILVNAKNNPAKTFLVEIQQNLAEMSQRSVQYNGIDNIEIVNSCLQDVHKLIGDNFDVVVCNPPYKQLTNNGLINESESIAIARHEIKVTLEEIIAESAKLLKFGGQLYLVNKDERLTDIILLCTKYCLEPKELVILPSSKGANIIMLRAKKGGRRGIKITLK